MEPNQHVVSIIVPTKNSSRTLAACLRSIKGQTYPDLEVIVVDGNSSDSTINLAESYGATVIALDAERTTAKNMGTSKSRGDFLLYLDSDMVLDATVVENCVRLCSGNKNVAGIIIPERSVGTSFWVRVRDFERSLYEGSRIESARFFRKDIVQQVGGFDEGVVFFEESTLPQKIEAIGLDITARVSSYIFHDENGFNLRKWLRKKRYYVNSAKAYSAKYSVYAHQQMSISSRLKIFVSDGKWKRLVRHPILACGLFTLKTLEYIFSKQKAR
jgi:glycosyltransferase involved in cell wall biosynthesis